MRLLASGCSYTDYKWTTWADVLGNEFAEYCQVGQGGADNAFIARSIVNNARPGDTVIAMWTSYDRWSFYSDQVTPLPKNSNNHWQHIGSLALWDKYFFTKYYHQVERFQTTMDYIQLVDLHSQANNYTVHHFSAFPFFSAETDQVVNPETIDIYNRYSISNNHLTNVLSLREYCDKHHNILIGGNDPHPSPACHWDYAEQVIAPILNLTLDNKFKQHILNEQQELI